jgi:hypothetical protein
MQSSNDVGQPSTEFVLPRLPSGKVDVDGWIKQQGVTRIKDPDQLEGTFWPEDESVDDFVNARRQWGLEGRPGHPSC